MKHGPKYLILVFLMCALCLSCKKEKETWIFMLAGQSNMAGRGKISAQDTTVTNPRVLTLDINDSLVAAKDPLHYYEPKLMGVGCGISFANTLLESVPDNVSILLVPTAVGGSSILQWLNDEEHRKVKLLSNFKHKLRVAQKHGQLKGILWHQGESDAGKVTSQSYKDSISKLVTLFRKISDNKIVPIIAGELGSFSAYNEDWQRINSDINVYAETDPDYSVVNTSDLKDKGDKVHFSTKSQRELGKRFAITYLNDFYYE